MALTLTKVKDSEDEWGGHYRTVEYTAAPGTSDYPTGGYAITPANVGQRVIKGVLAIGQSGANANQFIWIPATGKLMAVVMSTGAELANASDLAGLTLTLQFICFG